MTITLDLTAEQEVQLRERAAAAGLTDPADFLIALISNGSAKAFKGSGQDLLDELDADQLLIGYGDPAEDSVDLARRLRAEAENRSWRQ